ncbi:unnamed protein product [Microthlaspi erraticum]|uniref:Uncharacterized protein n=1 Tax=Microthlaspi erraticum TaxID=1685480 RepID=A0A6D2K9S0_9BRAS|nr:unnamed protein product [Microthlaspi erraticum]
MCWTNHVSAPNNLRKEPIGCSHSFQEDRIKEVMIILNGPIRFSYPAAWKMDQWKGAIQVEWIMMEGAAVGVPQHHWSTQGKRWRHSGGGDHSPASLPSL